MIRAVKKSYDWLSKKSQTSSGLILLAILFFLESFILIIPVDPLLIMYCTENQKRAWLYAALATVASTLGGLVGYLLGSWLWQRVGNWLIAYLFDAQTFDRACLSYKHYQHWAVFIAGLTPLPYKAVTISAGFCRLPLCTFTVFSLLGRGTRFFILAGILRRWGEPLKNFIDRYFTLLLLLFLVLLATGGILVFYEF